MDPLQRGPKGSDAVDGNGQTWDVKSFDSRFPGKGMFTLSGSLDSIQKELNSGSNVLVETRWMSLEDVQALQQAVLAHPDWSGRVKILLR